MLWHLDMNVFFQRNIFVCKYKCVSHPFVIQIYFLFCPFLSTCNWPFYWVHWKKCDFYFTCLHFKWEIWEERKRGSISKRHRNIARKLTNFHFCYFVGSIYQFLLSTLRTCGRFVIKIWWRNFFILNRRMPFNVNKLLVVI